MLKGDHCQSSNASGDHPWFQAHAELATYQVEEEEVLP